MLQRFIAPQDGSIREFYSASKVHGELERATEGQSALDVHREPNSASSFRGSGSAIEGLSAM